MNAANIIISALSIAYIVFIVTAARAKCKEIDNSNTRDEWWDKTDLVISLLMVTLVAMFVGFCIYVGLYAVFVK